MEIGGEAAPDRGDSSAGSRVSLVCNVCSRLLPKEWFAERPMASARANSRVPQPRHLCIIMLRPPLLPRTPQAPLLPPEREVCPPSSHPPPPYFASRPSSSASFSSSSSSFSPHPRAFSLPSRRCTPIRQTGREDRHPRTRRESVQLTYVRIYVCMYVRTYVWKYVRTYVSRKGKGEERWRPYSRRKSARARK